jgi:hypothetical protein
MFKPSQKTEQLNRKRQHLQATDLRLKVWLNRLKAQDLSGLDLETHRQRRNAICAVRKAIRGLMCQIAMAEKEDDASFWAEWQQNEKTPEAKASRKLDALLRTKRNCSSPERLKQLAGEYPIQLRPGGRVE